MLMMQTLQSYLVIDAVKIDKYKLLIAVTYEPPNAKNAHNWPFWLVEI